MTVCYHSAPNILLQPHCHMQDLVLVDKWACARYYKSSTLLMKTEQPKSPVSSPLQDPP